VGSFVIIGYRQAEGDLERPGEPEGTEFFFGDVPEAREGAVENDSVQFGSLVSLHPFAGQGYAQGAAEALAQDVEWAVTLGVALGQPAQAGFYVVQGAFYVWCAGGLAIAP